MANKTWGEGVATTTGWGTRTAQHNIQYIFPEKLFAIIKALEVQELSVGERSKYTKQNWILYRPEQFDGCLTAVGI